jgi:hypothetical protein
VVIDTSHFAPSALSKFQTRIQGVAPEYYILRLLALRPGLAIEKPGLTE